MPQIDIKYSANVTIDCEALFQCIEQTINLADPSAGICKSRAYPAETFKHKHIAIDIRVLRKPHRDEKFMKQLLQQLKKNLKTLLIDDCYMAIHLDFCSAYYVTQ